MTVRGIVGGFLLAIAVLAAAAAAVIVSGWYDVGADSPRTALVAGIIAFARERAIDMGAANVTVPPLGDPRMIAQGAEHYAAMCTGCHLAPGMAENEMRRGLYPRPPVLVSLPRGNPAEQFWIIKHGVKMTAMPAWGPTHSDREIWNIVAFLQKLPVMPSAQYRALTKNATAHHMQMGD